MERYVLVGSLVHFDIVVSIADGKARWFEAGSEGDKDRNRENPGYEGWPAANGEDLSVRVNFSELRVFSLSLFTS